MAERPDGAGNIITDQCGSTTYNYHYNGRDRLDQLTVGSTVTANYAYDGLERMAIRSTENTTPTGTTHYLYDRAGHLLVEASGTGTTQREYVWLDDMPLALFADLDTGSPQQWYVHPDQLNRPSRMTDVSKAVVWDAYYWPYGEARSITVTATRLQKLEGKAYHPASPTKAPSWRREENVRAVACRIDEQLEAIEKAASMAAARAGTC